MRKLVKLVGILAGTYLLMDVGWIIGVINCDDYYAKRSVPNKSSVEAAMELNDILMSNGFKKSGKTQAKRSDVLRERVKQLSKKGYSSEEIKRDLDNLRKHLN